MDDNCGMVKEKLKCKGMKMIIDGEHSSSASSWPQKNFSCSFCKRQFSSAQALGGHMNVHRKDRARLKQLPSWLFDSPNPKSSSNPNPCFSSSSSPSSSRPANKFLPYFHSHDHSSFPSYSSPSYKKKMSMIECTPHGDLFSSRNEDLTKNKNLKKKDFAQNHELENLKMGCKNPSEVLDLELRLGHF